MKALEVEGELNLSCDSKSFLVKAIGSSLNCEFTKDNFEAIAATEKHYLPTLYAYANSADKSLKQAGLSVTVSIDKTIILKIGSGAKRSLIPLIFGSNIEMTTKTALWLALVYYFGANKIKPESV